MMMYDFPDVSTKVEKILGEHFPNGVPDATGEALKTGQAHLIELDDDDY